MWSHFLPIWLLLGFSDVWFLPLLKMRCTLQSCLKFPSPQPVTKHKLPLPVRHILEKKRDEDLLLEGDTTHCHWAYCEFRAVSPAGRALMAPRAWCNQGEAGGGPGGWLKTHWLHDMLWLKQNRTKCLVHTCSCLWLPLSCSACPGCPQSLDTGA